MYNPNKFKYEPLKRIDTPEGRRYATPDGNKLPSVTTILDATKSDNLKKHWWSGANESVPKKHKR